MSRRPQDDETETSGAEWRDAGVQRKLRSPKSEDEAYDIEGSLKTTLVWDASTKQLHVCLRQLLQTQQKMELKYKGLLNTVTGDHRMKGQLLRNFQSNTLSLQKVYLASRLQNMRQRLLAEGLGSKNNEMMREISQQQKELNIDPDSFLPAGLKPLLLTDWCVCPGLTFNSERSGTLGLRPALLLRKTPQVLIHSPRTDLMLSGKTLMDFEPGSNKVTVGAGLRLKLYKFNVTSKQDLKVCFGLDLHSEPLNTSGVASGKAWARSPYIKISENSTSVKFSRGQWTFQYTL